MKELPHTKERLWGDIAFSDKQKEVKTTMKRKHIILVAVLALTMVASIAQASVGFTNFTLTFTTTSQYTSIVTDTTSVANPSYGRLYLYSNTSSVNCVWRAIRSGSAVTGLYYDRVISSGFRQMIYTTSLPVNASVTLQGRPDSSVSSCTVTGAFGAG
jgi:hypothetical protein